MEPSVDDPSLVGMWEPITSRFNHLPVHVALLRTGKVLAIGGSGNDPRNEGRPFRAEIWDPAHGGDGREVGTDVQADLFCSGHASLPDGRILVAGGTRLYDRLRFGFGFPPFRGHAQTYVFDPVAETWARLENMRRERWYPTLLTLPDGSVLAAAGLGQYFPWFFRRSIETFTPDRGWRSRRSGARWLPLYPRLHRCAWDGRWIGRRLLFGKLQHALHLPLPTEELPDRDAGAVQLLLARLGASRAPAARGGGVGPVAAPAA